MGCSNKSFGSPASLFLPARRRKCVSIKTLFHLFSHIKGSTLIFLAARQSLPDATGPDQMFTGPDQLFVSEVRKCIITWFSLADTKQFQSHFTLNIY